MKNNFVSLLIGFLLVFGVIGCGANNGSSEAENNTSDKAKIQVTVKGYSNGTARLIGWFASQQYLIDSAKVDGTGQMIFERDSIYQQGLAFVMLPDQNYFPFLLSEDQEFELATEKGDLQGKMVVTGSIDNKLYYENDQFEKNHQKKFNEINTQLNNATVGTDGYSKLKEEQDKLVKARKAHLEEIFTKHPNSFFTSFKRSGQNPDVIDFKTKEGYLDTLKQVYTYRTQFWDNVDLDDERLLFTPVISNKLTKYITELTAQNPDSIISAADFLVGKVLDQKEYYKYFVNWIALNYEPEKSTVMDADAIYAHMIKKYFTKEKAFWSTEFEIEHLQRKASEMSASLVGMKGPDVKAKDPSGNMKAISDLQSDYVIVFMYSPECEHCIKESPKMVQFYKEWKNKGVEVFGIGLDTEQATWEKFVKDFGLDVFTNVYDPTNKAIYKKYYVDVTPEIYVLNKDRIIIGKNLDVEQIPEIIKRDQNGK
ncbi:MAG: redoxin domain-containing protein [Chitinophagales bacterium]